MSEEKTLFSTSENEGGAVNQASNPTKVKPNVRFFTKAALTQDLLEINGRGWIENTLGNSDGVQGDMLELLLEIPTNNLPIADASGWELKTQKKPSSSLISLSHSEPNPKEAKITTKVMLPNYGWRHQKAGTKYPENELSFRMTMNGVAYTDRGFKLNVDRTANRVNIVFDSTKVSPRHSEWLESVKSRVGLGDIPIQPYYDFSDFYMTIGRKFLNCFLVLCDVKTEKVQEEQDGVMVEVKKKFFHYNEAYILEKVDIQKFLDCIEDGTIKIEFDARTGHNHGTKMRIAEKDIRKLYKKCTKIM